MDRYRLGIDPNHLAFVRSSGLSRGHFAPTVPRWRRLLKLGIVVTAVIAALIYTRFA